MKTEIKIPVRVYPVELKDTRTGERITDTIVLEKRRIQAGAMFDLGDEDIIYRIYNRQGFRVLEIGKPVKVELPVDLTGLYKVYSALTVKTEVEDAVANCNAGEPPTVKDLVQWYSGAGNDVSARTVQNWVKKFGFYIDKNSGKIHRTVDGETE